MSLQQAARRDDVETLRELLKTQGEDRVSALVIAAYSKHTDCVRVLLQHGVQVNEPGGSTDMTPLLAAADIGKHIAKILFSNGL